VKVFIRKRPNWTVLSVYEPWVVYWYDADVATAQHFAWHSFPSWREAVDFGMKAVGL
jgi:hypothetical protein